MNMTLDIGSVLSRAWQIIWKYKVLWIFGILASCSGGGGGGNGGSSGVNFRNQGPSQGMPPRMEHFFNQFSQQQILIFVAAMVLLGLLLIVILTFLGTIGRIGLVRGTVQAEQGAERLSFGELFSGSLPYFWRVFLLNLLVGLAIFFVVMLVVGPAVLFGVLTAGIGMLCLLPLLCLFIPVMVVLSWVITVTLEQANSAIVVDNLGIMDGLRRGWQVVRDHIGSILVMGLILILGIEMIGGLVIGLPIFLIIGPVIFGAMMGGDQAVWGGLAVTLICLVAYLPVAIALGGILRSYTSTAWTLTYLRLTGHPAGSPQAPAAPLDFTPEVR